MVKIATENTNYTKTAVSAANILIANTMGILSSMNYRLIDLGESIKAFRDILWNRDILLAMRGGRGGGITRLFSMVRLSRLPRETFRSSVSILSLASCDESQIFPYDLEEWSEILARFHLYDRLPFEGWLPIIRRLIDENITSPWAFAKFSFAGATQAGARLAGASLIMALWQCCFVSFTSEWAEGVIAPFRHSASIVA